MNEKTYGLFDKIINGYNKEELLLGGEDMNLGRARKKLMFGYFASALIGILCGGILIVTLQQLGLFGFSSKTSVVQTNQKNTVLAYDENAKSREPGAISAAVNRVMPAVVGITSTTTQGAGVRGREVKSVGSGIIADSSGLIVTNNHVAGMDTKNIVVSLADGREVNGTTVWADESLDLAVVKIQADNLVAAPLGDSKGLLVGEDAIAIGNPLGLSFQRTVTAGIVSALNRTVVDTDIFMEDLIQTDASINNGNSGGPLINIKGEVIGINTIKVPNAEGMGFAIPINIIKPVVNSIKGKGTFTTPIIGIKGIDKEMNGYQNIQVKKGILINEVLSNGPAQKAGLAKGDTILEASGKAINTMVELKEEIFTVGVNNQITLKVQTASGQEKQVSVKLEASQ